MLGIVVNVIKGEKAMQGGEAQRTGGEAYLETMFCARLEASSPKKEF